MQTLRFSFNWNNKLNCASFTTLRLSDRFVVGEKINIELKETLFGSGTVVGKKSLKLSEINDFIAYIDTGYGIEECQKILKRMYSKIGIDWTTQKIYFYLIKKD